MEKDKEELLEIFYNMSGETRALYLSYEMIALTTQEIIKYQYGVPSPVDAARQDGVGEEGTWTKFARQRQP
jgi:hypothetical protein